MHVADTDGLVKVLSDAKTDRILGVHIVGSVSWPKLWPVCIYVYVYIYNMYITLGMHISH